GPRQRRTAERVGPGAAREHVRRTVRRQVLAVSPLLQRGHRAVPRPRGAGRIAEELAAPTTGPAGAPVDLGRWRPVRYAAPPRRGTHALDRRLVARLRGSGGPGRVQHRRGTDT